MIKYKIVSNVQSKLLQYDRLAGTDQNHPAGCYEHNLNCTIINKFSTHLHNHMADNDTKPVLQ